MITPSLCRAARGLLDWSQAELATASGVGQRTIRLYEGDKATLLPETLAKLSAAIEATGCRLSIGSHGVEMLCSMPKKGIDAAAD